MVGIAPLQPRGHGGYNRLECASCARSRPLAKGAKEMKMAHRLAIATMCAALAGCASHTTSALAPVPAPNMLQPTAHGSGPQVIQTTSGSYIRACGAQASPLQMRCYALARPALFDGRELIGKSSGFYAPADLQS